MATSVTFEQENLISPIKLSFRTIQGVTVAKEISHLNDVSHSPVVLWRDYLIVSYYKPTHGLFLWNMTENSLFYFEVCHSFFSSPGALNPNSRQMETYLYCSKVVDDVLFVNNDGLDDTQWIAEFSCIHIPSLVTSTQLPGGSCSLTESAFPIRLPKCITGSRSMWTQWAAHTTFYSIPACPPTHPRYCFIIKRFSDQLWGVQWEVLEVEIDLSTPGPIKIFSRVSRQYTIQRSFSILHDSDDDLLLYLPSRGGQHRASPSVRFLRIGKPDKWRVARLGGVDKMHMFQMGVDRDAGYIIIWATEGWPQHTRVCGHICWLDERKAGDMVYSRTKELISSWSRGLLRRF